MNRRHWIAIASLTLAAAVAQPAFAQDYDPDCKPIPAEDQRIDLQIARGWPPIGLGLVIASKACQAKNYLDRLLTRSPDLDKATVADVFDAARPQLPETVSPEQHYKEEREAATRIKARAEEARRQYLRSNPADEAVTAANAREAQARELGQTGQQGAFRDPGAPAAPPAHEVPTYTTLPPLNPNGFIRVFEGSAPPRDGTAAAAPATLADIDGEGTLIDDEGMKLGTFKDGELEGMGQEITAKGAWRGGYYENGQIEGPGFEVVERRDAVYAIEGDFVDDKPEGYARVILSDGSSRIDLWRDGKLLAVGTVAAQGKQPVNPVYKSPEQLAAEEADRFETSLQSTSSAGALYALADELAEKGESARATLAFRRILTRFPDSPFALRASDRLAAGVGGRSVAAAPPRAAAPPPAAPRPAPAVAGPAVFSGIWQGEQSGNQVSMQLSSSGITVDAVTHNPGQSSTGLLYAPTGGGIYTYRFPEGGNATIQVLAQDRVKVVNPDGWNDVFRLVRRTN